MMEKNALLGEIFELNFDNLANNHNMNNINNNFGITNLKKSESKTKLLNNKKIIWIKILLLKIVLI